MNADSIQLYGHTLARMEPAQLVGMATRKARETCLPQLPIDIDERYDREVPAAPTTDIDPIAADLERTRAALSAETRRCFRDRCERAADGNVRFLARSLEFDPPSDIDWFDPQFDRFPFLWRLKLYAFEPLRWAVLGFDDPADAPDRVVRTFDAWLSDWIETVQMGRPGYLRGTWTPWAVSLRIQTLARYLAWRENSSVTTRSEAKPVTADDLRREIYKNALFQANHVERGVGGNHLVENGAALLTAGVLFRDADREWYKRGRSFLGRAGAKQFLADGGHFERSLMYHALVTTRYVTACSLLGASGRAVPAWLREMTRRAVEFLAHLRPPDGRIPLFNDAVFGQSLPLDACLAYASAAGVGPDPERQPGPHSVGEVNESGYYWLDTDIGRLLVDGGPVGPRHLPGHSHNDMLSFVLWADGNRVITDTGAFSYAADDRRQYARGVAGHNTVQVGDREPIPIGGRYLMGARTAPDIRFDGGSPTVCDGYYETAAKAPASYRHRRSIVTSDSWWLVWDDVRGRDVRDERVTSRLHFHPDVSVDVDSSERVVEASQTERENGEGATGAPLLRVRAFGADNVGTTTSEYYPRFGVSKARTTLELDLRSTGDAVTMGVLITEPETDGSAAIQVESDRPVAVRHGGREWDLPSSVTDDSVNG